MTDLFPSTVPLASGSRDSYGTPDHLFDPLNEVYHFTLDPCAEPWSAKCKRFYTRQDDGLSQNWSGERVFLNPPFSDIRPWLGRVVEEDGGPNRHFLAVCILPAAVNAGWWKLYVDGYARWIWNPARRVQFIPPPGITASSNNVDVSIVGFGCEPPPGWRVWRMIP